MIQLETGMIFCSRNPMWLGRAINGVQRFWSSDNQSEYSHAGIIVNADGDTFESLWTIRMSHLSSYVGDKILIGRLVDVSESIRRAALHSVIDRHSGKWYPAWRLVFHLIPPMAKYISAGRWPVCSELVMEYVKLSGIGRIGRWQGKNPDHVADMIKYADECEVVYEGVLEDGQFTLAN